MDSAKEPDMEPLDEPPFGSLDNPILADGVDGQFEYLQRLRTEAGCPFLWHRLGSWCPSGSEHFVDVYELMAHDASERWVLALSLAHKEPSEKAPDGLVLHRHPFFRQVFTGVNERVAKFPLELPLAFDEDDSQVIAHVTRILEATPKKAWENPKFYKIMAPDPMRRFA